MLTIRIKEGREKLPLKHHPWIFSGAIDAIEGGDIGFSRVVDSNDQFIAYGYYDEKSHIALHLLSWNEDDEMGDDFIRRQVKNSVMRRADLMKKSGTTCFRLIHGDADFLPGVAADSYGKEIRMIISSRFADHFTSVIVKELDRLLHPSLIEVTVDKAFIGAEGLKETIKVYKGGEETKERERENAKFIENGIIFVSPSGTSQKSGFYCDQRDNRMITEEYAKGRTVLDMFSYTGAFTLHALRGGAKSVDAVDSSESVLRHLLYQVNINVDEKTIPEDSRERVTITSGDCFDYIRTIPEDKYDLIILDPPKLAKTKASLDNAMKAYKDLNRVAMTKIKDNGIIATFSCSAAMTREKFMMMLAWAASDANAEIQVLRTLSAGEDHPVRLSFPESEYLKGAIIRVMH